MVRGKSLAHKHSEMCSSALRTTHTQLPTQHFGQQITAVEQCMNLGVMTDRFFSYDVHIRNVALKAIRLMGMVLKTFSTRNIELMVKIFATYIRLVLEYVSIVWSPSSVALNDQLNNVQRRFTIRLRGMFRVCYDNLIYQVSLKGEFTTIYIFAFKAVNNLIGPDAEDISLVIRDTDTQSQWMWLLHYDPKSALLANTYMCRTPIQWEKILGHAATCHFVTSFKKELKQHFSVF